MKRISLIVFSGIDGCGKSTQIRSLERRLREAGAQPYVLWTRVGYTPLFSGAKAAVRFVSFGRVPSSGPSRRRDRAFRRPWLRRAWLLAAITDLMVTYGVWIRVQQRRGRTVICDRYLLDSEIDLRLNYPSDQAHEWPLFQFLRRSAPRPSVGFALSVSLEDSLLRSKAKADPFPETPEKAKLRFAEYSAVTYDPPYVRLDGSESESQLAKHIWNRVSALPELDRGFGSVT